MNLRTFIERPVLSAVISITIVILGIHRFCLRSLWSNIRILRRLPSW